jgi:uncharacterized membrane protein
MKNTKETEQNKKEKEMPIWLLTIVIFAIVIAGVLIGIYIWKFYGDLSEKQETWGQFGDYIGGILNPLFSLTALFALLYTIYLQSKELRESTKQLKISAEALRKQNEVSETQKFEATFFQMLTLFNEIINSIETIESIYEDRYGKLNGEDYLIDTVMVGEKEIKGRKCFNEFYENLQIGYRHIGMCYKENEVMRINECYKSFYHEHQCEIGHYFRMLYNIIKFIKNSNVSNKHFYTNLVRAQLSSQELLIIFYNGLSELGNAKLKPLIEEFALLKTVPKNRLILDSHRQLYADRAYLKSGN